MLADPAADPKIRASYEALKASVTNALAITGQALEPGDGRTQQQQYFDRHFAMEPNPVMVAAVLRDARDEPPAPARLRLRNR